MPGAFTAALKQNGRIGWIPRRAGDRTAAEGGCLPNHGGADGRDTTTILKAAAAGQIGALVVGGVEVNDLPDPTTARYALDKAFVVSLEVRQSEVTDLADVVFPVAPPVEKSGGYVGWDGNFRSFPRVLETQALPDARVLRGIADELGKSILPVPSSGRPRARLRPTAVEPAPDSDLQARPGRAVDLETAHRRRPLPGRPAGVPRDGAAGRAQGERSHAGRSGHRARGHSLSSARAAGSASFPAVVDDTMVDGVVWAPTNNGQQLGALGMHHGSIVSLTSGGSA